MFGKSIFQSVLERLESESEAEAVDAASHAGMRGFNAGLAFNTEPAAGQQTVRQAYADMAGAEARSVETPLPSPKPPVIRRATAVPRRRPLHLDRLKPVEIAEDLKLCETETAASLTEKRRVFAAANHPDRFPPEDRPAATTRMTIANMMIDEALRRLKRGLAPQRLR